MTSEQKIQFIREKCIEANPSIKDVEIIGRDIRLADVLAAIRKLHDSTPRALGQYCEALIQLGWLWRVDSLTDQSPETIVFIYSLLK